MRDRVILHCDCNSFFASVETVLNPALKDVPMAVCGSEEARHGIVLAKNDLAKKYGIKTAETVYSARKKCPSLVTVPPHHDLYVEYSRRANEIYSRYTDMIEPFGIDESWLDVTASQKLFGSGEEIAEKISRDIKKELGITISVGVSFNKVFAKLGSDYKKPDAITVIERKDVEHIVYPLPVSDLLFVGNKTADQLRSMGIRTIGELASISQDLLIRRFGKLGEMLFNYARGLDDSPVEASSQEVKSISCGFTFKHDLLTVEECRVGIDHFSDEIATKLRRRGLKCSTVQLTIKNEHLSTIQRQCKLLRSTDIGAEISEAAVGLLKTCWNVGDPIRMMTVGVSSLLSENDSPMQISFLDQQDDPKRIKKKNAEDIVDKIRQKHGEGSIIKGSLLGSDIGIYDRVKRNDKE